MVAFRSLVARPLTLTRTYHVYGRGVTRRLVRHGDSAALILDEPILEMLNVTMDTRSR